MKRVKARETEARRREMDAIRRAEVWEFRCDEIKK